MFDLVSPYSPAGDQPQAIAKLVDGLRAGAVHQTLLGVTGSGKTFTIANVVKLCPACTEDALTPARFATTL